ncbi:MAG: ubiquinol-cytochrome c reductase cytochrome b subunit, partial [Actinomycetota bacterium]|nr:ubiquinol-cytochrome c reductase cytochrome b subunit [Actinomycetota bacterium]
AAQPDWYMGWIEGALRIMPPAYVKLGSYNISEIFWPAILLPTVTFALLFLWPFLEARFTGDHEEHHLLDRPSERPIRTSLGVVVLTFYSVLLLAGGQDIWAQELHLSLSTVLWTFRILVFVLPVVLGLFTWKVCRDLAAGRHAEHEEALAEPPIAVNQPEPERDRVAPPSTPEPQPEEVSERSRWGRKLQGVVILFVLRRAGARPRERTPRG